MVPIPNNRQSKTASLLSTKSTVSVQRKRQSRQSLRYSATIQARRGHDKLELIDTKAHLGNNSGRVLDQVASSFSSISGRAVRTSATSSYIRRELWQERTPTSHDFPHIKSPHSKRRHVVPRGGIRARSARLRRGLSVTLYSYCSTAKIPFFASRHWRLRLDKAKVRRSIILESPRPKTPTSRKKSMATIQISEPWSPQQAASRADIAPPTRKTSLPFKSATPSPLGCHPPSSSAEPAVAPAAVDVPEKTATPQYTAPTPPPPVPIRHPSRHRKRDSFNRAKIHIRRPPKGVVHWFDAIDDVSDEDDTGSQKSPKFNSYSVAPIRSRGTDSARDYFSAREVFRSRGNPRSPGARRRRNRESQLAEPNPLKFLAEKRLHDNSSDDEDSQRSRPWSSKYWDMTTPSPGAMGQVYLRRAASHRKASINTHTARQSMASAQTSLTSASLPFMLRMMPTFDGAPPLPDTPPAASPDYMPISYFALTGRLPGGSSGACSPVSEGPLSAVPSSEGVGASLRKGSLMSSEGIGSMRKGSLLSSPPMSAASHMMAVTEEEMALLEAMRRKRNLMQAQQKSAQSSAMTSPIHAPQLMPLPLRPVKKPVTPPQAQAPVREESERKASSSSTITLEDGEDIEFPTPPTNDHRPGSNKSQSPPTATFTPVRISRSADGPAASQISLVARQGSRQNSYWSPEISTPGLSELEKSPFGGPFDFSERPSTSRSTRLRNLFAARKAVTPAGMTDDDPFNAFSVEFGDLHLPPLSHPGCDDARNCTHSLTADGQHIPFDMDEDAHSAGSVSPGLTDGDTSSCGRTSRNEAETPNKNCTFTATAFEIVDSSDEDSADTHRYVGGRGTGSILRGPETPLLGKVDNMYAFAAAAASAGIELSGVIEESMPTPMEEEGRIEIGCFNAFGNVTESGYTAVR